MADSVVSTMVDYRPHKIPKLDKTCEGSESYNKQLKIGEVEDDEFIRQYVLFYYQIQKSEGFTVDWEQFDYVFATRSLDNPPEPLRFKPSSAETLREVTLFAIEKHNEAKGTKLEFVEHIRANYRQSDGFIFWLTFWARDMSAPTPESKIYQAKLCRLGKRFKIPIFRVKPSDEEIASIEVEPPFPIHYDDYAKPPFVFARAGPEDGVPFVFSRQGSAGLDPDKEWRME